MFVNYVCPPQIEGFKKKKNDHNLTGQIMIYEIINYEQKRLIDGLKCD